MSAPSIVFTIARVAEMLDESEEFLEDVAGDMEPEDGCLCVVGLGEEETTAFTSDGIDNLRELIPEYKKRD